MGLLSECKSAVDIIVKVSAVLNRIIIVMGILSGVSIVGGIIGILWNAISPTQFKISKFSLSTGHVGVAFVALGLICMVYVIVRILKCIQKIAELEDRSK